MIANRHKTNYLTSIERTKIFLYLIIDRSVDIIVCVAEN